MHVRSPDPQLVERIPVSYIVFDLLHLDGASLLGETYDRRRALLEELGIAAPRVQVPPAAVGVSGAQLLEVARAHGLEGVVGKRRASRYEPGRRSPAWIKTALLHTQEVVIGGWTVGEGRRAQNIGALLLGAYDGTGSLRYLGHVGTGFTEAALRSLLVELRAREHPESPFDEEVPRDEARKARWVRPELVGEVVYRVLTKEGRLRHAAWRGLRSDKAPAGPTSNRAFGDRGVSRRNGQNGAGDGGRTPIAALAHRLRSVCERRSRCVMPGADPRVTVRWSGPSGSGRRRTACGRRPRRPRRAGGPR
jgi:bifunctional non-homologous end joining protein LigD